MGQRRERRREQGDTGRVFAGAPFPAFSPSLLALAPSSLSSSFPSPSPILTSPPAQPNYDEVIATDGRTFGEFTESVFKRHYVDKDK